VSLTGRQKAALLLTSLDAATAAEMLKGLDAATVQELAVELSYLDAAGFRDTKQTAEVARQFCQSLRQEPGFRFKDFLRDMLRNSVGEDQAKRIQQEIQDLLQKRDPFLALRSTDLHTLAGVLETEHPQAVAVVLSALPPKRGSELLGLLGEGIRISAISRMASIGSIPPEAKARIAQMVQTRLEGAGSAAQTGTAVASVRPEQALRQVAILVRNLDKEIRDDVLDAIQQKDRDIGDKITSLMIIWEDLGSVSSRSLQQGLRGIDERHLTLAMHEAPEELVRRVKASISERSAIMMEEEKALLGTPKKEDVRLARQKILNALRELSRKGELSFEE
jgi:flagellar motor switch protein FliG